jgi:hypothetical protein
MFDKKYTNKSVYPNSGSVNVRKEPTTKSDIVAVKSGYVGRTSGAYLKMADGVWFQVNIADDNSLVTNQNNVLTRVSNGQFATPKQGYVRADVVNFNEPKNSTATLNAQAMLNKLVESDKNIYTTLVKLAPIIKQLRSQNKLDENTLTVYKGLLQRLYQRQQAFIKTKLVKYQTGTLDGYEQEKKDLAEVWAAIGIAPLVVGLIIGVIIAVGAITACYYAFKPNYEDSKADFILSKNLDETCRKKLTPEEYAQLKKEGEKLVDDAYNYGKSEGKVSLVTKIIAFAGTFWAVDKFILSPRKGK